MTRKRYDSVWDAIEETAEQAQNMKLRATLTMALQEHIARAKLNQTQAARLFGVTQPRIANLIRGRIDRFALETLVNMATAAGMRVELRLRKAA